MSAAVAISEIPEDELLTIEEFAMIDFDELADLVGGKVQFMGLNNPDHGEVLGNMTTLMRTFVKMRQLGKVYAGSARFRNAAM